MLQSGETVRSREVHHKVVLAPTNLEDCERCVKFYILRCLKIQNANCVLTLQSSPQVWTPAASSWRAFTPQSEMFCNKGAFSHFSLSVCLDRCKHNNHTLIWTKTAELTSQEVISTRFLSNPGICLQWENYRPSNQNKTGWRVPPGNSHKMISSIWTIGSRTVMFCRLCTHCWTEHHSRFCINFTVFVCDGQHLVNVFICPNTEEKFHILSATSHFLVFLVITRSHDVKRDRLAWSILNTKRPKGKYANRLGTNCLFWNKAERCVCESKLQKLQYNSFQLVRIWPDRSASFQEKEAGATAKNKEAALFAWNFQNEL